MNAPAASPLPRLLVLTDRAQAGPRLLHDVVGAAVAGGARAVVVREKDLRPDQRSAIVVGLRADVELLLVASDPSIPADGVHLASYDPMPDTRPAVVGRSCHDAQEIARAVAEGCDYVTVSPVFVSASKPGYGPPLGVEALHELAMGTDIPVYGLGGITQRRVAPCLAAGAYGVAAMGEIMRAPDPGGVVGGLLAAMAMIVGDR